VRARLAGLGRRGVLSGWHAMVNPRVLSLKVTRLWVEFASEGSKEEGMSRLLPKDELRVVYDYAGSSLSFVMATNAEQSLQTQRGIVENLPQVRQVFAASMKFPPTNATLSETDWSIYNCIRSDPQKTYRMISKETGLGARTIKRHLNRLSEQNAILAAPNLDPTKVEGISADLLVRYKGDATRVFEEETASEISDRLIHVERFDEPCVLLTVVADSVSEAREIHRVIRTLPRVTSSHLYFQQGLVQIRKPLSIAGRASSRRKIPLAAALDFERESKVRS
jgi:DNA-binding Lrp family transcriptional regulator